MPNMGGFWNIPSHDIIGQRTGQKGQEEQKEQNCDLGQVETSRVERIINLAKLENDGGI